jgi:hypothetical protein
VVSRIFVTLCSTGAWLLDERLLHKRLDIRIKGTLMSLYRNGRYENRCGFLVLTEKPPTTDTSVQVKVGYEESRLSFPLRYLFPETTTERPTITPLNKIAPITSTIGERVVVIGPDLAGDTTAIGLFATTVHCNYHILDCQACVLITTPGQLFSTYRYFHSSSLCRSTAGPFTWFGIDYPR